MHKLKEKFKEELYEYEEKVKRNPNTKASQQELERIHLLSDSIKNFDKIEMLEDSEGYSGDTDFMGEGRMFGTSYRSNDYMYNSNGGQGGSSYARGRGRNAKRDSRGRYSRDGYSQGGAKESLIEKLEEAMDEAENEQDREKIRKVIMQIENA